MIGTLLAIVVPFAYLATAGAIFGVVFPKVHDHHPQSSHLSCTRRYWCCSSHYMSNPSDCEACLAKQRWCPTCVALAALPSLLSPLALAVLCGYLPFRAGMILSGRKTTRTQDLQAHIDDLEKELGMGAHA